MSQLKSRRINILVTDDEPDIREVLSDGLAVYGFSVRTVGSGRDAVLEALKNRPDAAIMDILMPNMSGMETLGIFKIIEPLRTIPVFMLTALKNREDVVNAMRAGAADYIGKPFDLKDTAERIKRACAKQVPAPAPVFRHLRYEIAENRGALRIAPACDLTLESAGDLSALIQALTPMQPARIELDFGKVPKIEGRSVAPPLVAARDGVGNAGGEVVVGGLDPKKFRPAAIGLIRNIFPAAEAEAAELPPGIKKVAPVSRKDDKILSDVLTKISGFRFDFKKTGDHTILELAGELTADHREKITHAFGVATDMWTSVLVRMDKISKLDARGMTHLVQQVADFKQKTGLHALAVAKNPEIRKAYHAARGNLVAGIFEDKDKALSSLRSG